MAKTLSNYQTMTASQITDLIVRLWDIFNETGIRHVLHIEGPPGGGKTAIVHAAAEIIAERMNLSLTSTPRPTDGQFNLRVIHLGNIGEEVMAGLPWVDKQNSTLHRAMDVMWPTTGTGILHLDEPFQVGYGQRFYSQLASEGRFGDYFDLGQYLLISSGNAQSDRAGTQRIWTHVQNRIIHVRLQPEVDTVLRHFTDPATPEVSVYLRWFPDKLHDFKTTGEPFASPRTWDKVNNLLANGFDPASGFPVIQGYVGNGVALDFKVTFDAVKDLPDIDAMLADPDSHADVMRAMGANNPASVCAMASVFVRRWRGERDTSMVDRAIRLMAYSSAEHAAAFVAVAEQVDDQCADGVSVLDTPAYTRYMAENAHLTAN